MDVGCEGSLRPLDLHMVDASRPHLKRARSPLRPAQPQVILGASTSRPTRPQVTLGASTSGQSGMDYAMLLPRSSADSGGGLVVTKLVVMGMVSGVGEHLGPHPIPPRCLAMASACVVAPSTILEAGSTFDGRSTRNNQDQWEMLGGCRCQDRLRWWVLFWGPRMG